MVKDWYYSVDGSSVGPVTPDALDALIENGTVNRDTLVWHEGMDDWLPLGHSPVSAEPGSAHPARGINDPARADANTFTGALKDGFARYTDFKTRATRPQFWWWVLWMFILSALASAVDAALGLSEIQPVSTVLSLGVLIPNLAIAARRLHDTGRTAWWLLLMLIPILGVLVLIVFCCFRSEAGVNKWGPEPDH